MDLNKIKEVFDGMKPFKKGKDGNYCVHSLPILRKDDFETIVIPNLIRCGAIPKSELVKGKSYEGSCRNSSVAKWEGDHFVAQRTKFGSTFNYEINHFEDDNGSDLFIPIKEID